MSNTRLCECDRCNNGSYYTLDQCRKCWLFHHNTSYNLGWGGNGRVIPITNLSVPYQSSMTRSSIYKKSISYQLVRCTKCLGNVQFKLHPNMPVEAMAKIIDGPHDNWPNGWETWPVTLEAKSLLADKHLGNIFNLTYYSKSRITSTLNTVRHLLYHIHPVSGSGIWQQNVRALLKRIELFNGHRVVAITTGRNESGRDIGTGELLDSPQHVKDAFNGTVHEFIEIENDPNLREVASFLPLYERIETLNPNHVCLWAHAKGVTSEVERSESVPIWRNLLYELYLDYWPLVEEQLREFPVTGAFYKIGLPDAWKGISDSDWHYSGSWWWFRCSELFGQKDWRKIDRFKYGIEPYPSLHFSKQQAGCIFFKGEFPTLELYSDKYLREVVLPAYEVWKRDHIQYKTQHPTHR